MANQPLPYFMKPSNPVRGIFSCGPFRCPQNASQKVEPALEPFSVSTPRASKGLPAVSKPLKVGRAGKFES